MNPLFTQPARIALITGVSRQIGIGAAIAHRLADVGIDIFTTYYRPFDRTTYIPDTTDDADQILAALRSKGVRAAGVEADLSDPATPARLFDSVEAQFGSVDILINNAAFDAAVDLLHMSASVLDTHYAVNVRGTALLCAEFAWRHDGRPDGRIVNMTSGQGLGAMPDNLPYAISKGAIEALTISIAPTVAAKGITVNAVDPGATDSGWMNDQIRTELAQRSQFGRVGQPIDAANLIAFLVSPDARWITGQILRSRGGL
jgi:3-oxoacyl-[acyl-carrier protein] reductase